LVKEHRLEAKAVFSICGFNSLIEWMGENIEPYNEKHKNFIQSLSISFGILLKSVEGLDVETEIYNVNADLVLKVAYAIACNFPGQLKKYIKRIKTIIIRLIAKESVTLRNLAIKVLAKLCDCGSNTKEEARILFNDTIKALSFFMNSLKPRTISEVVTIEIEEFRTCLLEGLIDNVHKSLKSTTNPYKWLRTLIDVIRQVLWHNSNEILIINLELLLTTCFDIINSKQRNPDVTKSFIYGLSVIEYNLFLNASKCEILCLLIDFIKAYSTSLYPNLNFILTASSTAYSLTENINDVNVWQYVLQLIITLLRVYGFSAYDLTTSVIFLAKPNLLKNLLSDLRELVERCDKSVIKKDSKFFTSTEVRGHRQRKKKKVDAIYIFAKSEIETAELIHNISSTLLLLKEYVERCQVIITKEHRASIEAIVLSVMELSYINTFVEFPLDVKELIFDLVCAMILFPGVAKAPSEQLLLQFTHFIGKAKESDDQLNLEKYTVAIQGTISEMSSGGGEMISYKELIIEQNRRMLEGFLGVKANSVETQTEAIVLPKTIIASETLYDKEGVKIHLKKIEPHYEEVKEVVYVEKLTNEGNKEETNANIEENKNNTEEINDNIERSKDNIEEIKEINIKETKKVDMEEKKEIGMEEKKVEKHKEGNNIFEIEDSDSSIDVPAINFD